MPDISTRVAQATSTPSSGASRAEDFQPPTQNPQQVPGSQEVNGDLQNVGDRQLLTDNPNVRITIPVNPADGPPAVRAATTDGAGWSWWFGAVLIVIFILLSLLWLVLKRTRQSVQPVAAPLPESSPPEESPAPEPPKPVQKPNNHIKKKTKRKKKRK